MKKDLDWVKTGTVAAMAEWLRSKSDELCVVVVRVNDAGDTPANGNGEPRGYEPELLLFVLAADPRLAPADAMQKVAEYLPQLAADLEASRKEKRSAARLELERVPE